MSEENEEPEENAAEIPEGEEGEFGEEGEEGAEKSGTKKIILVIIVGLIVLIGAGAGLYFTGMLDSLLGKDSVEEEHSEEGEHGDGHGDGHDDGGLLGGPSFLEVPPMIINLNTTDGVPRYLRLKVQLELKSLGDVDKVEAVLPRVVDQFQTYLRELRIQDLRGSSGIYRLQMELLWRVNQAAYPVEVRDVLFQEILIQ